MHICIPTKNRLDKQKTLGLLKGYPRELIHLYVEPQEYSSYVDRYGEQCDVVNIRTNDMGIAYVRNFIIDHMQELNQNHIWMIDDDIHCLFSRDTWKDDKGYWRLKSTTNPAEIIMILQKCYDDFRSRFSNHIQYGISFKGKNNFTIDVYREFDRVYALGVLNIKKLVELELRYDNNLFTFDDYDLIAQYYLMGCSNVVTYEYAFDQVRFAKGKGGLKPIYDNKELTKRLCEYLQKKYPSCVSMHYDSYTRIWQVDFDWGRIRKIYNQKTQNEALTKWS